MMLRLNKFSVPSRFADWRLNSKKICIFVTYLWLTVYLNVTHLESFKVSPLPKSAYTSFRCQVKQKYSINEVTRKNSKCKIETSPFLLVSPSLSRVSRSLRRNSRIHETENDNDSSIDASEWSEGVEIGSRRERIRKRVRELAQSMSLESARKRASNAAVLAMPQAVAAVLKDATLNAVEMAMEEIMGTSSSSSSNSQPSTAGFKDVTQTTQVQKVEPNKADVIMLNLELYLVELIDDAFLPLEKSIDELELSLQQTRNMLRNAKQQAAIAIQRVQKNVTETKQQEIQSLLLSTMTNSSNNGLLDKLSAGTKTNTLPSNPYTYEDVDFTSSEMAPPFLDEGQCLVPGEPVVRVEKAPDNARRIFAGIDIMASVDTVWGVLTNYSNLQNVVPNLVVNEVLAMYNYDNSNSSVCNSSTPIELDESLPEDEQCRIMCESMKGSLLRQVGGTKVAGIQFSARTTLEVREWPNGMPDFAHFADDVYNGQTRANRATAYAKTPLMRYRFPRPFAISSLPTKDISMQSIVNDDGEFRIYQGVWRLQPLPGCAPPGQQAMRLTYAVQISPRAYLPVALIESRIVKDLCTNLLAIRDYVTKS